MVRFGLIINNGWKMDLPRNLSSEKQWQLIINEIKLAETLGWDHIWMWDHFHPHPIAQPGWSVFETWTTLAAIAPMTKKIRLGQLVTCTLFRNPAYLAKISSLLDVISCGRLEFGLGAGWYEHEFKGYGYPFPSPRNRILMMDETIEIIKRMWTEPRSSFNGKYYQIEEALNDPKPLQKPHPPILVGGGGEKYTLKVVAKHANKWNWAGTPEAYKDKIRTLEKHCGAIGRNFKEIALTVMGRLITGPTIKKVTDRFKEIEEYKTYGSFEEAKHSGIYGVEPFFGTYDEVNSTIERYLQLGVSEFMFSVRGYLNLKLIEEIYNNIIVNFN